MPDIGTPQEDLHKIGDFAENGRLCHTFEHAVHVFLAMDHMPSVSISILQLNGDNVRDSLVEDFDWDCCFGAGHRAFSDGSVMVW